MLLLPWHEPVSLSKPAGVGGCWFMQKWFSGREFVAARNARLPSGFVRTAIADSVIAVWLAASKPGVASAARPIAAIKGVWRAGSIIVTGNVPTGDVTHFIP